jgi:hypothetical protein
MVVSLPTMGLLERASTTEMRFCSSWGAAVGFVLRPVIRCVSPKLQLWAVRWTLQIAPLHENRLVSNLGTGKQEE